MNPITTIQIRDMPLCIREGFPDLAESTENDDSVEKGNVMSEVGFPEVMSMKAYRKKFISYVLRGKRKNITPGHIFGKAHLGEAFSAFLPRTDSIPAIGTTKYFQPVVTYWQKQIINWYRYISADVTWIIHVPSPIGASVILELLGPEFDKTTTTRSVRFRPAGLTTISVTCPWSSDLTMVDSRVTRPGQSGGALAIRTVEDNSQENVNTPLNITLYCCVTNINLSGLIGKDALSEAVPGLNFGEIIPSTTLTEIRENSGEGSVTMEVEGEGVGMPAKVASEMGTATTNIIPQREKPAPTPDPPKPKTGAKNSVGALDNRYVEWMTITLQSTDLLLWKNVTINPYTFGKPGEAMKLPFRRNLWVGGGRTSGYSRMLKVKAIINRPPSISGLIEFQDSINDSSRILVPFGGTIEMDLIPQNFAANLANVRPRAYNSPWLRTDETLTAFRYRLTAFNRTADIEDIKIRLLVKPGEATFHTPRKPLRATTSLDWVSSLWEQALTEVEEFNEITENSGVGSVISSMNSGSGGSIGETVSESLNESHQINSTLQSKDFIAPQAGQFLECGEIDAGEADLEEIDQDDFGVEVYRGVLENGVPLNIPLNLSVMTDLTNPNGDSTLQEKFQRYAHIVPSPEGNLGPTIGTYTVMCRLPTTVAGNIAHIAVPQDLSDEIAAFAFGLSDILSLATTALSGVGGPLVGGAINVGKALLGKLFDGFGSKVANMSSSDTANPIGISGPIDVSRFLQFLKPVAQNLTADPSFSNLLLLARDLFDSVTGFAVPNLPISVWVKMDRVKVERSTFERGTIPTATIRNVTVIPYDRVSSIIQRFSAIPNLTSQTSYQHECFYKYISYLSTLDINNRQPIILEDILALSVTPQAKQAIDDFIDAGPSGASFSQLRTTLEGVEPA